MTHKVKIAHSDKSREHGVKAVIREGTEVYRHPLGRFVVLEFQGVGGKFREVFWPEEILISRIDGLFLD